MIAIVDGSLGNIHSIANMLKKGGFDSTICTNPEQLQHAKKIILPGVGHYDFGMENLSIKGFVEVLNQKVLHEKIPVLGICLGAQMMGCSSEEGQSKGLGWMDMKVKKFAFPESDQQWKIPNMGWNQVKILRQGNLLFNRLTDDVRFYFVHSYYMVPVNGDECVAVTHYGFEYAAAVHRENIYGVQFHPEKSHRFGLQLLQNFALL